LLNHDTIFIISNLIFESGASENPFFTTIFKKVGGVPATLPFPVHFTICNNRKNGYTSVAPEWLLQIAK
jgi:hypothetical protein